MHRSGACNLVYLLLWIVARIDTFDDLVVLTKHACLYMLLYIHFCVLELYDLMSTMLDKWR